MQSNKPERVLSRMRARDLTDQEVNAVHGFGTGAMCTFNPKTRSFDGDCTPEPN